MRKTFVWALAFLLLSSVAVFAGDETASYPNVPKIVRIRAFEVMPGRISDYESLNRQVRAALSSGNADYHFVVVTPSTGHDGEVTSVAFFDNYTEMQRAIDAYDRSAGPVIKSAEFNRTIAGSMKGSLGIIAKLQTELSYNLAKFDLANATKWEVTTIRVRPGYESVFRDVVKEAVELHKRGAIEENWAMYEVKYGAEGGTFYEVRPLRGLADLDADLSKEHKAVFTEAIGRRFETSLRGAIISEKTEILSVRPEWSRAPQNLVAANPTFWTVKEEPTAVAATKGKKAKPPVEPAAMKQ